MAASDRDWRRSAAISVLSPRRQTSEFSFTDRAEWLASYEIYSANRAEACGTRGGASSEGHPEILNKASRVNPPQALASATAKSSNSLGNLWNSEDKTNENRLFYAAITQTLIPSMTDTSKQSYEERKQKLLAEIKGLASEIEQAPESSQQKTDLDVERRRQKAIDRLAATHGIQGAGTVNALIHEFLEAEKRGRSIDRYGMLAAHPEHSKQLLAFFAQYDHEVGPGSRCEAPEQSHASTSEGTTNEAGQVNTQRERAIGGSCLGGMIGAGLGVVLGGLIGASLIDPPQQDERLPITTGLFEFAGTVLEFIVAVIGAGVGGILGAIFGSTVGASMAANRATVINANSASGNRSEKQ